MVSVAHPTASLRFLTRSGVVDVTQPPRLRIERRASLSVKEIIFSWSGYHFRVRLSGRVYWLRADVYLVAQSGPSMRSYVKTYIYYKHDELKFLLVTLSPLCTDTQPQSQSMRIMIYTCVEREVERGAAACVRTEVYVFVS